jgi:hypothetical protein
MGKRQVGFEEAQELSKQGKFLQFSPSGVQYDSSKEPNPDTSGNGSRTSFLFSCYYHPLGKFFQEKIKSSILTAIDTFHGNEKYLFKGEYLKLQEALYEAIRKHVRHDQDRKQPFLFKVSDILVYGAYNNSVIGRIHHNRFARASIDFAYIGIKKYDKEAFVYDDVRLSSLSSLLKTEITNFRNDETLLKIIDICIFLMKEDVYYRPRWIQILQDIKPVVDELDIPNNRIIEILKKVCDLVKDMELTDEELNNIQEWH